MINALFQRVRLRSFIFGQVKKHFCLRDPNAMLQEKIGESSEVRSSRIHDIEKWIGSWQETQSIEQPTFLPSSGKLPKAWPIWGKVQWELVGLLILSILDEWIATDDGHWYLQEPGEGWKRARRQWRTPTYSHGKNLGGRPSRCFFQFRERGIIGNNNDNKKQQQQNCDLFFLLQHPTTPFPY